MRRPLVLHLIPVVAALVMVGGLPGARAAGAAGIPNTAGIDRPIGDDPVARGSVAPVAGVVPGLTGPAAQQAAGAAADRFRQLAAERTAAATTRPAAAAQLHTSWGLDLPNNVSKGLTATQSVIAGAAATTGGDYVYAPTAIPASGACIEMTTAYTPSGPDLWAWDWCGGRDGVGKLTPMDSTFLATYTITVNGHAAYSLDEHQTSSAANTWTSYLYNYKTHVWDSYFTSSGTYDLPQFPFGWDMFEIYTSVNPATGAGYYCQDMDGKAFESSSIKVLVGSTWTPAAPGNSSPDSDPAPPGSSFDCPTLNIGVTHPDDDWIAQVGASAGQPRSYEAEAAGNTLAGQAAVRSSPNASGGAVVGYIGNGSANYLQFNNVTGSTSGVHTVTVYYASGANRSVAVSVNGAAAVSVNTPSTGGWDTIGSVTVNVTLVAGTNTVRLGGPTGWAPDVDRVVVS